MTAREQRTVVGARASTSAAVRRAAVAAWVDLWATTALGAGCAAAGVTALRTPAPHDALDGTLATATSLFAHNALVALWPLALVALRWPSLAAVSRVGDALVATQLLAHGLVVGGALASHPAMWRYLPHLPIEWLALAIPAAIWTIARARPLPQRRELAAATAASLAAISAAAVIETYAVPL
jgi:hypothetical protein